MTGFATTISKPIALFSTLNLLTGVNATTFSADVTNVVLPTTAAAQLGSSGSSHCPAACSGYRSGAHAQMPFVAMVVPSGVPVDNAALYTCYPPYNAREDWTICYQPGSTAGNVIPMYSHHEVCAEIAALPMAPMTPDSGMHSERSTAATTKGGWHKLFGDLQCGWGATWNNVSPAHNDPDLKTEITGIATEYDCCMQAMAFEGTAVIPGQPSGSPVRFQRKSDGRCVIDREIMVRSNLDGSSGRSMRSQDMCSTTALNVAVVNGQYVNADNHSQPYNGVGANIYWRHAAGGAEAANLRSGGSCAVNNGFTRFNGAGGALKPAGALNPPPLHNELPNHQCKLDNVNSNENCSGYFTLNPIGDAEQCCEACASLNWVTQSGANAAGMNPEASTHMITLEDGTQRHNNPCVAWQIYQGRCRIIREKIVTDWMFPGVSSMWQRFDSNGVHSLQTILERQGQNFFSCIDDPTVDSERSCNYYSHIYYKNTNNTVDAPQDCDQTGDSQNGQESGEGAQESGEGPSEEGAQESGEGPSEEGPQESGEGRALRRKLNQNCNGQQQPAPVTAPVNATVDFETPSVGIPCLQTFETVSGNSNLRRRLTQTIPAETVTIQVNYTQIPSQGANKLLHLQTNGDNSNWASASSGNASDQIAPSLAVTDSSAMTTFDDGSKRLNGGSSLCTSTALPGSGSSGTMQITCDVSQSTACSTARRLLKEHNGDGARALRHLSGNADENLFMSFNTAGDAYNRMSFSGVSVQVGVSQASADAYALQQQQSQQQQQQQSQQQVSQDQSNTAIMEASVSIGIPQAVLGTQNSELAVKWAIQMAMHKQACAGFAAAPYNCFSSVDECRSGNVGAQATANCGITSVSMAVDWDAAFVASGAVDTSADSIGGRVLRNLLDLIGFGGESSASTKKRELSTQTITNQAQFSVVSQDAQAAATNTQAATALTAATGTATGFESATVAQQITAELQADPQGVLAGAGITDTSAWTVQVVTTVPAPAGNGGNTEQSGAAHKFGGALISTVFVFFVGTLFC